MGDLHESTGVWLSGLGQCDYSIRYIPILLVHLRRFLKYIVLDEDGKLAVALAMETVNACRGLPFLSKTGSLTMIEISASQS